MAPNCVSLLLLLLAAHDACSQPNKVELGYELQYASVPDELINVPMNFTGKAPLWLNGSLIRVGPALFELYGNKDKSSVTNALDGLAKVAHWKFLGNNNILFSTAFIRSNYYNESISARRFKSNIFLFPTFPPQIQPELSRSLEVGIDNMDISIVGCPDPKNNTINYVATNDIWSLYEFSLDDLSTLRKLTPNISDASGSVRFEAPEFIKQLSTSHSLPEPNTDNNNRISIVLEAALNPAEKNVLKVVRIKYLDETEVISKFEIPEIPLIHSFSVSQTKVVILMNPFILNVTCMINNFGDCYNWTSENETKIHIVDLHTRNVQEVKINRTFVYHHINAYDESEGELVVDVAAHESPVFFTKFTMSVATNSWARQLVDPRADIKRIRIHLGNNTAEISSVDSPTQTSKIASTLDYPVINEANRSRSYCYVYGVVEKIDSKQVGTMGIAKKDLCNNDGRQADALFQQEGWYPSEPTFVATPGATAEDDGVLLVPYTAGEDKRTHLIVLDARDLTFKDIAKGPILIPQSQHGIYVDKY